MVGFTGVSYLCVSDWVTTACHTQDFSGRTNKQGDREAGGGRETGRGWIHTHSVKFQKTTRKEDVCKQRLLWMKALAERGKSSETLLGVGSGKLWLGSHLLRKMQLQGTMSSEIPSRLWDFTFNGWVLLRTLNSPYLSLIVISWGKL